MKVAIIGAGFAGIALSWHLLQKGAKITVFDEIGIGGGASGIAAGLCHAYTGAHARKKANAEIAISETKQLLEIATHRLKKPVFQQSGILRLAITPEQKEDFAKCAKEHQDVSWCTPDECRRIAPGVGDFPGILIHSGLTVNCAEYLSGLWQACLDLGGIFCHKKIENVEELSSFDQIVLCAGFTTLQFKELSHLKLRPIKGQLLKLSWPNSTPPLKVSLNSKAYIVMHPELKSCYVGATFEKRFTTIDTDLSTAKECLLPKVWEMFPPLQTATILKCSSGIRVTTPDHMPIYGHFQNHIWYFTGLGSKGLLYHAVYAKRLAFELLSSNLDAGEGAICVPRGLI